MQSDEKKDLSYYMVRWLAFGAAAGIFSPAAQQVNEALEWEVRLERLLIGLSFGAACGYAFTHFQNKFNERRDKKVSISIAIAIWMGFNFAFAGLSLI